MPRLEDSDSDDTDTASTNGSYFFSSWGYGDRLILRGLYRRYVFSKVHIMKKIEQSGRGRSCGHWPMWRAMAKAVLSDVRKKVSLKDLENFFWDVLAEGSDVSATLDQLLDCRNAVTSPHARSRAVVPKLNVKPVSRTSATTFSDDSHEGGGQQKTALHHLLPNHEELPLDLSSRQPLGDDVKVAPFSIDGEGVVALLDPTTVENGGGAATNVAMLPASVASLDNDVASMLDFMLAHISVPKDCQPDASTVQSAFVVCPWDTGLIGGEPMSSGGSVTAENADAAAAVRRIIIGASPEPTPLPVQRVDQGVQCELDSTLLFETMLRDHLLRMEALRVQRDAFLKQIED